MREILNNQNYRPILYVFGAYLALALGALILTRNDAEVVQVVSTLAPICALLALLTALWARYGLIQTENSPEIWGRMVTGLVFWTIAEGIWSYYILNNGGKKPYPNVGDIFWLIGYVPLIEAMVIRYQSYLTRPEKNRVIGVMLFILSLVIPIAFILTVPAALRLHDWAKVAELIVTTSYSLATIAILPFAMLTLITVGRGRLFKVWGLIAIAFILRAAIYFLLTYPSQYIHLTGRFATIPTILYSLTHLVVAVGIYGSWLLGQQVALSSQLKMGFIGKDKEIPHFLINTDVDGKIVNISNNFLQFTNNSLRERYLGKPVQDALNLSEPEFNDMTDICSRGGFVTNQDVKVAAGQKAPVPLLLTAVGSLTSHDYFGLDIILQLPNYSASAYPLDDESSAIAQGILRRAGQQTLENSSLLAEYFVTQIQSFYDLVAESGGKQNAAAMSGEINATAAKNNWPIRVNGQEVTIEPGFDNFDNAELLKALPVLFKIAEQFSINATSARDVAEQIQKADQLLSRNVLHAAQHFGMRQS